MPPSPPTTTNPATILASTFRGRGWWLGSTRSTRSTSRIGGGTTSTKDGRSRNQTVVRAAPGGFVHYPPASVRRLRLRPQRPSPAAGMARGKRGMPSSGSVAGDPDDPENKGIKAFGVTSRRKDAIMKRTPLCGRSANARLPSWASCDNSAWDPGNDRNEEVGSSVGAEQAAAAARRESPVSCGTRAADAGAPGQDAPAATTSVEGGCEGYDSGCGLPKTSPSVSTISLSATAAATIITAVVPTGPKVEHGGLTTPGIGSRRSSNSSLATVQGTTRHDAAERGGLVAKSEAKATPNPELGHGNNAYRSPKRPTNPMGKARSGRRPHGNGSAREGGTGGKSAGEATAERWRLYPNPWRTPLFVRCMRRPPSR